MLSFEGMTSVGFDLKVKEPVLHRPDCRQHCTGGCQAFKENRNTRKSYLTKCIKVVSLFLTTGVVSSELGLGHCPHVFLGF